MGKVDGSSLLGDSTDRGRGPSGGQMGSHAALEAVRLGARAARFCLPLSLRKRVVSAMARRGMPGQVTIGIELLRDLALQDPAAFHQYLWANHLAYASKYDCPCFEGDSLESDRSLLFDLLSQVVMAAGGSVAARVWQPLVEQADRGVYFAIATPAHV